MRTVIDNKLLHANDEMANKEITNRKKKTELQNRCKFLGGFAKFAKSDYWLRHAGPSVRMEQLGSHWTDFIKFDTG